jgi:hypothetical protein
LTDKSERPDSGGANRDVPIGRGNPPRATQYAAGASGNPSGRPRGKKNLKTEIREELSEAVSVREGGKTKRVSKGRALVKTTVAKGLQGDIKAANTVFNLAVKTGVHDAVPPSQQEISDTRTAIFTRMKARFIAEAEAKLRAGNRETSAFKADDDSGEMPVA